MSMYGCWRAPHLQQQEGAQHHTHTYIYAWRLLSLHSFFTLVLPKFYFSRLFMLVAFNLSINPQFFLLFVVVLNVIFKAWLIFRYINVFYARRWRERDRKSNSRVIIENRLESFQLIAFIGSLILFLKSLVYLWNNNKKQNSNHCYYLKEKCYSIFFIFLSKIKFNR